MKTTTHERAGAQRHGGRDGGEPDSPEQLDRRSWIGVLKRTVREFKKDDLTDWAAALTY